MTHSSTQVRTPFIFLAEDDIDDRDLLIEALSEIDNSVSVLSVSNGRKAISLLEELSPNEQPALIVLDYNLPELSGADILKHFRSRKALDNITKVVWSTSNSPVYEKLCLELGAQAYLVKPSDISGIQRLAQTMLQMCLQDRQSDTSVS